MTDYSLSDVASVVRGNDYDNNGFGGGRGGLSFYSYSHLWEMDSMVIAVLMESQ